MKRLLFLVALVCLPFNAFSQESSQKVRISDFSGGMNSFDLADIINPNQGELVKNADVSRRGIISKRTGQAMFANDLSNTAFTGLGTFYPDTSTKYILAASGPSIVRSNNSAVSWVTVNLDKNLSSGYDTEFVQANDLLFILNGTNPTGWYDGITYSLGTAGAASPPTATTGVWLLNYLFTAGDPAHPDWIYFSNNLEPRIFTQGEDVVKINSGDGQKIQRLATFRYNDIIAYKERSIFDLNIAGDPTIGDWFYQPVTTQFGTVAPRSVVNMGNDQWFLSSYPFAIRSLTRSAYDKLTLDMVSAPIQDIFDGTGSTTINTTLASISCAVLYKDKYIIAIPTGSSPVNNTVCVYDFITKGWTVISGWYPAAWCVFNNNLYYADANDGSVVQCFTGTTGDMLAGPVARTSASTPTVAISQEWVSKNIDFDNPEVYKQLDAIDVEFGSSGAYDAKIYIEKDDAGFQYVGAADLSGGALVLPFNFPATLTSASIARKTFQVQSFGEFKKLKVKITQDGLGQTCSLYSVSIFANPKPWRREQ